MKKKIKVPTKLNLSGHEIEVSYVDRIEPPAMGDYMNSKIRIDLSEHKTEADLKSTIIHECLHAAIERSGWSELLRDISENAEEGIVVMLEKSLVPALKLDSSQWLAFKYIELSESKNDSHSS